MDGIGKARRNMDWRWLYNSSAGVVIEAEGEEEGNLMEFIEEVKNAIRRSFSMLSVVGIKLN